VNRRRFLRAAVGGAVVAAARPRPAGAQAPLKKPVKIVVTADAGGGEDTEARAIAPWVRKHLGVTVGIENQPGAGGKIAFEKFQRAEPDGSTLITYTFPKSIIIEFLDRTRYHTRDWTPVFVWSRANQLLIGHADGWKTFDEFLKTARSRTLSAAMSGRGSTTHLAALLAADELGIRVNWVPYEGAPGALAALAGKHVDFAIVLATSAVPLIRAGKLRPLLLLGDARDPYLADVPIPRDLGRTIASVPAVRGVEAPPRTPPATVRTLEDAFAKAVREPEYVEWARKRQMIIHPLGAEEFGRLVAETYPRVERYQAKLKD
jgi:tripartite-type tricarboxylate transporter receptor subunit TctC